MKTVADAIIDKFTKDYYKESTIDEVSKLFKDNHIMEIKTTCHNCGGILTAIRNDKGVECKCDTCGMIVFVSNDYN